MEIKNIYDAVIFTSAALTLRDAVLEAIKAKINLNSADLRSADLRSADLSSADLSSANLSSADLSSADLSSADLSSADLRSANLRSANNLDKVKNAELSFARIQFIPTEGAFIGWKKCAGGVIVKLGISKSAKRSHGTERKCRCSKAKCLSITSADGKPLQEARSMHDSNFIYRVGKVVEPDGWDENRWNTCGRGIHFYLTLEEAKAHA